jgi:hypothetical protein
VRRSVTKYFLGGVAARHKSFPLQLLFGKVRGR